MIVTRFAPSPTGHLHVGNIRTALINWLLARKNGGKFILRIDDTDTVRSEEQYVHSIKKDLEWLGLHWDEIYFQSERMEMYEAAKQQMIKSGRLYPCYESVEELEVKKKSYLARNLPPIYDRAALQLTDAFHQEMHTKGVSPHYRFLIAAEEIKWHDAIRGEIKFDYHNISDPILIRADGTMTYMIATVVDDIDLGITHIVRGEDHISNSAVHQQMFHALGGQAPHFAHLALIKAKDGKVSKREGGFDISALRQLGMHPMSILSFLAKVGSSDPIHYYNNLDELLSDFSLDKYGKSSTYYHEDDIKHLNEKLTHNLSYTQAKPFLPSDIDADFWHMIRGNLHTIGEARDWYNIVHSNESFVDVEEAEFLEQASSVLPNEPWDHNTWDLWIKQVKELSKRSGKQLFMPLRYALTGMEYGPELKYLLPLLGYNKVKQRLTGEKSGK